MKTSDRDHSDNCPPCPYCGQSTFASATAGPQGFRHCTGGTISCPPEQKDET